jgi:hypothetical protein
MRSLLSVEFPYFIFTCYRLLCYKLAVDLSSKILQEESPDFLKTIAIEIGDAGFNALDDCREEWIADNNTRMELLVYDR